MARDPIFWLAASVRTLTRRMALLEAQLASSESQPPEQEVKEKEKAEEKREELTPSGAAVVPFCWNFDAPCFVPAACEWNSPALLEDLNTRAVDLSVEFAPMPVGRFARAPCAATDLRENTAASTAEEDEKEGGPASGPLSHLTPEQQEFDESQELELFLQEEFGESNYWDSAAAQVEQEPRKGAEDLKNAGNDLYKRGKFEEALEMYDKAIAVEPNDVILYNNKCAVWIQMGSPHAVGQAARLGTALLANKGRMAAENPGGATPEKLAKVRSRLATALGLLTVWRLARQCFRALKDWEDPSFANDETGSSSEEGEGLRR